MLRRLLRRWISGNRQCNYRHIYSYYRPQLSETQRTNGFDSNRSYSSSDNHRSSRGGMSSTYNTQSECSSKSPRGRITASRRMYISSNGSYRSGGRSANAHGVSSSSNSENRNLVDSRYELGRKLGQGSFGKVYNATDTETGRKYAAKIAECSDGISMLHNEYRVYSDLRRVGQLSNIPKLYYYGGWNGKKVLIIDKLGKSLESHLKRGGTYSLRYVLMTGIQMNRNIKTLHDAGWLHRDIKPGNILSGGGDENEIYLVDFGVAKSYEMAHHDRGDTCAHSLDRIAGDVLYASPNCHAHSEASFRDDFFSLGYTMVQMYKGRLPWEGRSYSTFEEAVSLMKRAKENTSFRSLCWGMGREVHAFFEYVASLSFSSRVDHAYIEKLLSEALRRMY